MAKYCVHKTEEIIGINNITEYLEPSAGGGVFLDYLDKSYLAYDIEPEDDRIIKQDFLTLDLPYKNGRCIIGNPPFGTRNTMSVKFYKQAIKFGDYISFILPISQLDNNQQMYEFDLVHSENLGERQYTDRQLHCCLNIYKRNSNGLNKKPDYKLNDVIIKEYRNKNESIKHQNDKYDVRICFWGASTGKECDYIGQYAHEMNIYCINRKFKDNVINIIKNANWKELYSHIATPALYQWQIYKYIKEQIPEIE